MEHRRYLRLKSGTQTTAWHSAAVEVDEIVRASRLPAAIAFGFMPGDHSFDLELAACVLLTSLS